MPRDLYDLADIYDVFMGDPPSDTQLAFYDALIAKHDQPVLELACGTGRFTIPLAQRGYDITGLDLSATMLDRARLKADRMGLEILWIHADMRAFDLGRRFGFIVIPAQSFQHLVSREDVAQTLDGVRRHLSPGGAFLIQIFTPSPSLLARALDGSNESTSQEWYTDPDSGKRFRASIRAEYDPSTQVLVSTYDYRSDDETVAGSFNLTMRQFFPQEIDALLHHNGFDVLAKYGDAAFTPFDEKLSYQNILCRPRVILK